MKVKTKGHGTTGRSGHFDTWVCDIFGHLAFGKYCCLVWRDHDSRDGSTIDTLDENESNYANNNYIMKVVCIVHYYIYKPFQADLVIWSTFRRLYLSIPIAFSSDRPREK